MGVGGLLLEDKGGGASRRVNAIRPLLDVTGARQFKVSLASGFSVVLLVGIFETGETV